ncbi:hypothetical protein GCM10010145_31680 [Streptomyces ruber]|uniref:Uncharacterized protein n=2 Tax=Streptomyces TaxID=1883 RepID=A0A918BEL9_9ACTN|nr:hypothetical protein [Streptomyces ruber]GGQ59403.1 hypothetical protein GCM10010145_31680 [Streptomyces ruber]
MSTSRQPLYQVQVVLSDCLAQNASRIFDALCAHFVSDRCTGEELHQSQAEPDRPTVWSGTFELPDDPADEVSGEGSGAPSGSGSGRAHPGPLSGSVSLDAQGSPKAVHRLKEVLEETFLVTEVGTIAGDQEVQLQLRLEGARAAEGAR